MKMTKFLSLLLACMMLATLFSACGSIAQPAEAENNPDAVPAQTSEPVIAPT